MSVISEGCCGKLKPSPFPGSASYRDMSQDLGVKALEAAKEAGKLRADSGSSLFALSPNVSIRLSHKEAGPGWGPRSSEGLLPTPPESIKKLFKMGYLGQGMGAMAGCSTPPYPPQFTIGLHGGRDSFGCCPEGGAMQYHSSSNQGYTPMHDEQALTPLTRFSPVDSLRDRVDSVISHATLNSEPEPSYVEETLGGGLGGPRPAGAPRVSPFVLQGTLAALASVEEGSVLSVRGIRNLGMDVEGQLQQYFSQFGEVHSIIFLPPHAGSMPSGCFVVMSLASSVHKVLGGAFSAVHWVGGTTIQARLFFKKTAEGEALSMYSNAEEEQVEVDGWKYRDVRDGMCFYTEAYPSYGHLY